MSPRLLNLSRVRHCYTQGKTARWSYSSSASTTPSAVPPTSPSPLSLPSFSTQLPRTIASILHPVDSAQQQQPQQQLSEPEHVESEETTVHGWVRSVRKMKNFSFAQIQDGSTHATLQAVLTPQQAAGLSTGTSVQLIGQWKRSPGPKQPHELQTEHVQVLGEANPEIYPLQKKYQSPEFLRTIPHLRPRIARNTALLQLRSFITSNFTNFFTENEFVQCYPPIITSSDCEGAGEVFTVSSNLSTSEHFFKSPKYLTVSAQLHLEALAAAMPRVWALSPTFRAEKSDTNRHLSEFYMLETELSFIETLDPLLDFIETMIRNLVTSMMQTRIGAEILDISGEDKERLELRWNGLVQPAQWTRITYTSAIELLESAFTEKKTDFVFPPTWGTGLQSEHEKYLATHFNGPVFVTDYPQSIKPFYMRPSPSPAEMSLGPRKTVACFDLLLPVVGELIGGSLREHRYDELVAKIESEGLLLDGESLSWYAELRKYGTVPHGGFGMGMERLLCYLANIENIREAVAFPRWAGRCDC